MTGDLLTPLQESLRDELAQSIAKIRGGKGAGAMAYELLKRDKRQNQLIGVVKQGEKAIFYEQPCGVLSRSPSTSPASMVTGGSSERKSMNV